MGANKTTIPEETYVKAVKFLDEYGTENYKLNLETFFGLTGVPARRIAYAVDYIKADERQKLISLCNGSEKPVRIACRVLGYKLDIEKKAKEIKPNIEPKQEPAKTESVDDIKKIIESEIKPLCSLLIDYINSFKEISNELIAIKENEPEPKLRYICSRCGKRIGIREAKQNYEWYKKEYCFSCAQVVEDFYKKTGKVPV